MHMNNLITKHWKHVFIACLFSPVAEAQVDGFNKGAGNVDVVASLSYEKGLAYYLAEGTAAIKRSRIAATLFAAGGITEDLDLQLSIPFISNSTEAGFQDASVYLKWLPVKTALGVITPHFPITLSVLLNLVALLLFKGRAPCRGKYSQLLYCDNRFGWFHCLDRDGCARGEDSAA